MRNYNYKKAILFSIVLVAILSIYSSASASAACDSCIHSCQGLSGCCTGRGCMCEDECAGGSCQPGYHTYVWCSSYGDCMVGCQCDTISVPGLLSPSDGLTNVSTTPTLDWSSVPGALSYNVRVCGNSSCSTVAASSSILSDSLWQVSPALNASTTYWWQAQAKSVCSTGAWSTARTFTSVCSSPPAGTLTLQNPSIRGSGVPINTTLNWDDVGCASAYDVQICSDIACSSVVASSNVPVSQWQISSVLNFRTTYYWRARAKNSYGDGPWASPVSFTTSSDVPLSNGIPLNASVLMNSSDGSLAYVSGVFRWSGWKYYYVAIPSGATNFIVDLYNLSQNADLYVKMSSIPSLYSSYECRSWLSGTTSEKCIIASPSSDLWWIGINNFATGMISYTLKASWNIPACTSVIISKRSVGYSSQSVADTVAVTPSSSSCSWTAVSNASWITVTSGNGGTSSGTVAYSIATNTTGSNRTGTITIGGQTFTVTQTAFNAALYFPHVATNFPWNTEIAIVNTSPDQTVTGTLRGLSDEGQLIETKAVTLSARGRRQITIGDEFTNHFDIGYIIFDTNSAAVQGYTKFYQAGSHRAAIPAVKEVNTSDIYISHIASDAQWWTGVSLVNTTSATKVLTITYSNGQSVPYTLNANAHGVFLIQPDIKSAVITNASGIIGLELFGSKGGAIQMDGILLTDNTASTLYYPHVASNDVWWTGIVAYNPSELACTITITPYSATGTPLSPLTRPIAGKEKYIGTVTDLALPAQTAWFRIDSTRPLSGFELFGTTDGKQLAAYAEVGGTGAKTGVFAKIEKNGWTGIAFVNTEDSAASVTLTAYNDNGSAVATQVLPVGGHAKVVKYAEAIFTQNISAATYIAYSSDRNVVGFQLNGSTDGMILDGLPGLGGTN